MARKAAGLSTLYIGHGDIPDQPGILHEGYPVYFSIQDAEADGIVEWVRYIEVHGEIRILFAAEWDFRGGLGYETFPLPASEQIPIVGYSEITLMFASDYTVPGSIVLPSTAIQGVGTLPATTYIRFVTRQIGPNTIETVGSPVVEGTTAGEVRFRGVYMPSTSSLIPPLHYNIPR